MAFRDVFINCAFDEGFQPIFRAMIFAVVRSGFRARCTLELDDGTENRLLKIQRIIEECRFGIHDLSRTETSGQPPLPRFNMPMELGLFLGAKRFGDIEQKKKRALILDTKQYRYQQFISDIAGQDIHAHGNEPAMAIEQVASWLRGQSRRQGNPPGGIQIAAEFAQFQIDLPDILENRQLNAGEMTFGDYTSIVINYLSLQNNPDA